MRRPRGPIRPGARPRRRNQAIGIPISCAQAPIQIVEIARAPISWIAVMRPIGANRPARGSGANDPLARPEAGEGVGEAGPVGQRQLGVELEQGDEDEAPARHLAVGQGQALGLELEVAEQQQVDVERPRAVAGGVEGAPPLDLDPLAEVEQLLRGELGADPDRGVEEVGLVEDLARPARSRRPRRSPRPRLPPRAAARPRRADGRPGRRRWTRAPGSRSAPPRPPRRFPRSPLRFGPGSPRPRPPGPRGAAAAPAWRP